MSSPRSLLLLAALAVGCSHRADPAPPEVTSATATTAPTASAAFRPKRPLPAEPPPIAADLAAEVPQLEAKLAAIKPYAGIWDPTRTDDLTLLLSAVSQLLVEGAFSGPVRTAIDVKKWVDDAALTLAMIHWRTNHYPDSFTTKLRAYLDAIKTEPQHGVWSPYVKGQAPHDFSAVATWLHRDDPEYLREMLAARRGGPTGWPSTEGLKDKPTRPYLFSERGALEWLALLTPLTADEQEQLRLARIEANTLLMPLADLLGEYKANEVRADGKYKGKLVRVSGVAGDIKKDPNNKIYVIVGTGAPLESPVAQCFVAAASTARVEALSKGDKVTVRGRVAGLSVNVLLHDCAIQ